MAATKAGDGAKRAADPAPRADKKAKIKEEKPEVKQEGTVGSGRQAAQVITRVCVIGGGAQGVVVGTWPIGVCRPRLRMIGCWRGGRPLHTMESPHVDMDEEGGFLLLLLAIRRDRGSSYPGTGAAAFRASPAGSASWAIPHQSPPPPPPPDDAPSARP